MDMMSVTKGLGDRRMCLAIPMRIVHAKQHTACREAKGARRAVGLALLDGQAPAAGGRVLGHVDRAPRTIVAAEAGATWNRFDETAVALDRADG